MTGLSNTVNAGSSAPLFSVVIITYNRLKLLKRAVESVFNQSVSDFELIIVDNHSTDGTEAYVKGLSDPRVRFLSIHNGGFLARSRNLAIANCQGKYLAFLDSDDYWMADKLEQCLKFFKDNPDLLGVCHGERIETPARSWDYHYGPYPENLTDRLIKIGSCLSPSASVIRVDAYRKIGGFSEEPSIVSAEDYDAWIRLSRLGNIQYLNKILGVCYMHSECMSFENSGSKNLVAGWRVCKKHLILEFKNSTWLKKPPVLFYYAKRFLRFLLARLKVMIQFHMGRSVIPS